MKVLEIFQKICGFLKWFLSAILGGIVCLLGGYLIREVAKVEKVKDKKNWAIINDTTIAILDDEKGILKEVKLPKDLKTNKQIKATDIKEVGISKKGGEVHVEIKHKITNRRAAIVDRNNDN